MRTKLDGRVIASDAVVRIRTSSHYLLFKVPRTLVFVESDPLGGIVFTWQSCAHPILEILHERVCSEVRKCGFRQLKETVKWLDPSNRAKLEVALLRLHEFLSPELAILLKSAL